MIGENMMKIKEEEVDEVIPRRVLPCYLTDKVLLKNKTIHDRTEKQFRKNDFLVDRLLNSNFSPDEKVQISRSAFSAFSSFKANKKMHTDFPSPEYKTHVQPFKEFREHLSIQVGQGKQCTAPCCVPSPALDSPNDSRRSSETGSADSGGSTCNERQQKVREVYRDREQYPLCKGPCCQNLVDQIRDSSYLFGRDRYSSYLRRFNPYSRRSGYETCTCKECELGSDAAAKGLRSSATSTYYLNGLTKHFKETRGVTTPSRSKNLPPELRPERNDSAQICVDNLSKKLTEQKKVKNNENMEEYKLANSVEQYEETTDVPSMENTDLDTDNSRKWSSSEMLKLTPGTTRSRAVANLLERRRVAELNSAFEKLRMLVPLYGNEDRALSKIKTLKYALSYMNHLMTVLRSQPTNSCFDSNKDLSILSKDDPSIQKCREHMLKRKLF